MARDKVSLDIFRLCDERLEDSANLPDPDVQARGYMEDPQAALEWFARKGKPTATDVTNYIRNLSTAEAQRILESLVKVGVLQSELTHKGAVRYSVK